MDENYENFSKRVDERRERITLVEPAIEKFVKQNNIEEKDFQDTLLGSGQNEVQEFVNKLCPGANLTRDDIYNYIVRKRANA